jgi:hypothetical protein
MRRASILAFLLAFSPGALAGDPMPTERLATLAGQYGAPGAAMGAVCSNLQRPLQSLEQLAKAVGDEPGQQISKLRDLNAKGLDLESPVELWMGGAGAHMSLSILPGTNEIEQLLRDLSSSANANAGKGLSGLANEKVQREGQRITWTTKDAIPGEAGGGADPQVMVNGLPLGEGCAVYFSMKVKNNPIQLSLFLPSDPKRSRVFRVGLGEGKYAPAEAVFPQIRTEAEPLFVLTLGADIQDLVAQLLRLPALSNIPALQGAAETHGRSPKVGSGTLLAMGGKPGSSPWVSAVIPIRSPKGKTLRARQITRALRNNLEGNLQDRAFVEWTTKTDLRMTSPKMKVPIHIRAADGRLLLSTDPKQLDDLGDPQGTPWLSPEESAWGARQHLSIAGKTPELPGMPQVNILTGLRFHQQFLEVEFLSDPPLQDLIRNPIFREAMKAGAAAAGSAKEAGP